MWIQNITSSSGSTSGHCFFTPSCWNTDLPFGRPPPPASKRGPVTWNKVFFAFSLTKEDPPSISQHGAQRGARASVRILAKQHGKIWLICQNLCDFSQKLINIDCLARAPPLCKLANRCLSFIVCIGSSESSGQKDPKSEKLKNPRMAVVAHNLPSENTFKMFTTCFCPFFVALWVLWSLWIRTPAHVIANLRWPTKDESKIDHRS